MAIASQRRNEKAVVVFVNQPLTGNKDFEQLKSWKNSPFHESYCFAGHFPGSLSKLKQRKIVFKAIKELIECYRPENIFTGNDRRMEFQYAMHVACKLDSSVKGHYMDEGTFTYIGRKPKNAISQHLDNLLKKISYGCWWQEPTTIGASSLVDKVYVAYPDLIDKRLKSKDVVGLSSSMFLDEDVVEFSKLLLSTHSLDIKSLKNLDAVLTLPHESLFGDNERYRSHVLETLHRYGENSAVKYHPRYSEYDLLRLEDEGVTLLPAEAAFESLLMLLPTKTTIIGDVSSTLLTTRWIRPDLNVISESRGGVNRKLENLFKELDILIS
ncbi:hypothetical protein GCM10007941_12340 [Amphritea balenae]|nr:hypothetical protein GCM10007941_12340 [Amphritea balenae]